MEDSADNELQFGTKYEATEELVKEIEFFKKFPHICLLFKSIFRKWFNSRLQKFDQRWK